MAPVSCVPACSIAPSFPGLALSMMRRVLAESCRPSVCAGCLRAATNSGLAAHLSHRCRPPRPPARSYERSSQFVGRALRMPENANLVSRRGSLLRLCSLGRQAPRRCVVAPGSSACLPAS